MINLRFVMMKMEQMNEAFSMLSSKKVIERDKAVLSIKSMVMASSITLIELLSLVSTLLEKSTAWECKHGALSLLKALLELEGSKIVSSVKEEWISLTNVLLNLKHDDEVRVRIAAGDVLALVCLESFKQVGINLFVDLIESRLTQDIEDMMFLDRDPTADETENGLKLKKKLLDGLTANEEREAHQHVHNQKVKKVSSRDSYVSSESSIFHDTAGWKTLETDVKCIEKIFSKCNNSYKLPISNELMELVLSLCVHINRFTRESGFNVLTSLCPLLDLYESEDGLNDVLNQISSRLCLGLVDDWTEVCYASSKTTRAFLSFIDKDVPLDVYEKKSEIFLPALLPRMCFNRYHFAQGVKRYSLESWQLLLKSDGPKKLVQYMKEFVDFYISRLYSDNSEMRASACLCINELVTKIDATVVGIHFKSLFVNVLLASDDSSWSVREYACVCLSSLISTFPGLFKEKESLLLDGLFENICDETWSVRESSAIALGVLYICPSTTNETKEIIVSRMNDGLKVWSKMRDEREIYKEDDLLEAKKRRDNDVLLHSKGTKLVGCCSVSDESERMKVSFFSKVNIYKQLIASGDLAIGTDTILVSLEGEGEEDRPGHNKDEEEGANSELLNYQQNHLWQVSDGCLYLVREVLQRDPSLWTGPLIENISQLLQGRHYIDHVKLMDTAWKVLPDICNSVKKRPFKSILDSLIEPLHYSLSSPAFTNKSDLVFFVNFLCSTLGQGIFLGRVELFDPSLLETFNNVIKDRVQPEGEKM